MALLVVVGLGISMVGTLPTRVSAETQRPLASYSFDRKTGTTLFDESGNGNDCTSSDTNGNNIYLAAGRNNDGIVKDSSGLYVACTNKTLTPTTGLTVMAWTKLTAGGFVSPAVSMYSNSSTANWVLYNGAGWSEGYSAYLRTTTSSAQASSNVPVDTNVWHHIAMTYDGAALKIYVDGALKGTQALSGAINYGGGTPDMRLFTSLAGDDFGGTIDDLRVYGTALPQSDIQSLMNAAVQNGPTHTFNRSISMSTALPSAKNVTYSVSFRADQSYQLRTMLMDFCSNSPLSGQSCTAPGGFTAGAPPGVSNFKLNGAAVGGTWTASSLNSGRTFVFSSSTGVTVAPDDLLTFDITTVTNPNTITRYYARMFMYNFTSPTYTATGPDNFKETGGVALGTTDKMGITFEVPESLSFCVYKVTCGDVPSIALGHGIRKALDSTQIDTDTAKFSIATNAALGADVYGHGKLPSLAGNSGEAIDQLLPNASKATMTVGQEAFGIRISPISGAIAADLPYQDTGGNDYAFDSSQILTTSRYTRQATPGPFTEQELTITFAATVSPSTPAGWYSTELTLIAIATF
jgi:hypothetical protein